jgi:hypothetical protein
VPAGGSATTVRPLADVGGVGGTGAAGGVGAQLPNTGVLAEVLGALGSAMVLVGVALWTAGPRIRRCFHAGLR